MTHDPLCPFSRECIGGEHEPFAVGPLACSNTECLAICDCDLIAKVRADERDNTLDDAINLLEEMNCKRLWWDDMLTWCISVNEAIYNIDNLRGKREVV